MSKLQPKFEKILNMVYAGTDKTLMDDGKTLIVTGQHRVFGPDNFLQVLTAEHPESKDIFYAYSRWLKEIGQDGVKEMKLIRKTNNPEIKGLDYFLYACTMIKPGTKDVDQLKNTWAAAIALALEKVWHTKPSPKDAMLLAKGVGEVIEADRYGQYSDPTMVKKWLSAIYNIRMKVPNYNVHIGYDRTGHYCYPSIVAPKRGVMIPKIYSLEENAGLVEKAGKLVEYMMNGGHVRTPAIPAAPAQTPVKKPYGFTDTPSENHIHNMRLVKPLLGGNKSQFKTLLDLGLHSEEREFFQEKVQEIADTFNSMPKTYGTDGQPNTQKICQFRFFSRAGECYIIERDSEAEQHQAFGIATIDGNDPEMGYINIDEWTSNGAEIDLYYTPETADKVIKRLSGDTGEVAAGVKPVETVTDFDAVFKDKSKFYSPQEMEALKRANTPTVTPTQDKESTEIQVKARDVIRVAEQGYTSGGIPSIEAERVADKLEALAAYAYPYSDNSFGDIYSSGDITEILDIAMRENKITDRDDLKTMQEAFTAAYGVADAIEAMKAVQYPPNLFDFGLRDIERNPDDTRLLGQIADDASDFLQNFGVYNNIYEKLTKLQKAYERACSAFEVNIRTNIRVREHVGGNYEPAEEYLQRTMNDYQYALEEVTKALDKRFDVESSQSTGTLGAGWLPFKTVGDLMQSGELPPVKPVGVAPVETVSDVDSAQGNPGGLTDAEMVVLIATKHYKPAVRKEYAEKETRTDRYGAFDGISPAQFDAAVAKLNSEGRYLVRSAITDYGVGLVDSFHPELSGTSKLSIFAGKFANRPGVAPVETVINLNPETNGQGGTSTSIVAPVTTVSDLSVPNDAVGIDVNSDNMYGLFMRPPSIGALPKVPYTFLEKNEIITTAFLPYCRHGAIRTQRPLTPEEIKNFELVELVSVGTPRYRELVNTVSEGLKDYAQGYVDYWESGDTQVLMDRLQQVLNKMNVAVQRTNLSTDVFYKLKEYTLGPVDADTDAMSDDELINALGIQDTGKAAPVTRDNRPSDRAVMRTTPPKGYTGSNGEWKILDLEDGGRTLKFCLEMGKFENIERSGYSYDVELSNGERKVLQIRTYKKPGLMYVSAQAGNETSTGMFSFVMFGDFSETFMKTPGKVTAKATQVFLNRVAYTYSENSPEMLKLLKKIDDFYLQKSGR